MVETCSVECMVCFEDERIAALEEQHKLLCQEMVSNPILLVSQINFRSFKRKVAPFTDNINFI